MMTSFFSIFDPSTNISYSINWMSSILIFYTFPYHFWLIPSRIIISWNTINKFLFKEFKLLTYYSFSNLLIFMNLFFIIFWINFMGLFPYIFTSSSHISVSLSLSMNLWLSIFFFFIVKNPIKFFTHLTPINTPTVLIPIMILIEFISFMIRPITLSIRLSANMTAGHLLLSLLSSFNMNMTNMILFFLMLLTQIVLLLLEISISFIQAYVFSILMLLYKKEI